MKTEKCHSKSAQLKNTCSIKNICRWPIIIIRALLHPQGTHTHTHTHLNQIHEVCNISIWFPTFNHSVPYNLILYVCKIHVSHRSNNITFPFSLLRSGWKNVHLTVMGGEKLWYSSIPFEDERAHAPEGLSEVSTHEGVDQRVDGGVGIGHAVSPDLQFVERITVTQILRTERL